MFLKIPSSAAYSQKKVLEEFTLKILISFAKMIATKLQKGTEKNATT